MRRPVLLVALCAALAACGSKGELKPRSAEAVRPAPYGREQSLTTEALLTPPPQAAPERNVELRTRSEPRQDDPFNLPPGQ
jgi:predicted small lipoprotein YifL